MKRAIAIAALTAASLVNAADKPTSKAVPTPAVPVQMASPAQPASKDVTDQCNRLSENIEASEKEMAFLNATGIGDNSAPRETTRMLSRLSEQQMQSQNLAMMIALKCPALPYDSMAKGLGYLAPAMKCHYEVLKNQNTESDSVKQACDRSKWLSSRRQVAP